MPSAALTSDVQSSQPSDLARLCEYPASTCEERQSDRFSNFTKEDITDRTEYVTCELIKTNTACIEDLLCECSGMQLPDLVLQFDSARLEYINNCTDVEDHITRTEEIRCKDLIRETAPGDPGKDVIVGEIESDLELSSNMMKMEAVCPGYTHCINVSQSYNRRAEREVSELDRRVLVCEGSRLNILCLDDVLCACGWSREQVARRAMRELRHNHESYCDEDLTIGYLSCDAFSASHQATELCSDFVNSCERRVISHYKELHNKTDRLFVSCETFKTRVQCFEDYVCSCPGQQTTSLIANFNNYRAPYEEQCENVPDHYLRAGEIYCEDKVGMSPSNPGQELGVEQGDREYMVDANPSNPGQELGVEQGATELSLFDQVRQMKGQCPGYERCLSVTSTYTTLTAQQKSLAGQVTVSCEGSRYAIICFEDALCACGWANESSFRTLLREMRHQHEVTCNQDLTIGYLECGGMTVTGLSGLWILIFLLSSAVMYFRVIV